MTHYSCIVSDALRFSLGWAGEAQSLSPSRSTDFDTFWLLRVCHVRSDVYECTGRVAYLHSPIIVPILYTEV
jgi:hypothetical protein